MGNNQNFEKNMTELERIVEKLEAGDSPISEMVTLYERGTQLGKECMTMLESYEGRLEVLSGVREEEK